MALAAAEQTGEPVGVAFVLNSLGCIYLDREEWHLAATHFRRSLALFQSAEHVRGEAMALGNHSLAQANLGNHELARRDATLALALFRRLMSPRGIAGNLDNLGTALVSAGQHREAIDSFLKAAALAAELGDTQNWAMMQHRLGSTYAGIGEQRKAVRAFRESLVGYRALGFRRWEAIVLADLGITLNQSDHPGIAKRILTAALTTLTDIGDPRAEHVADIIEKIEHVGAAM